LNISNKDTKKFEINIAKIDFLPELCTRIDKLLYDGNNKDKPHGIPVKGFRRIHADRQHWQ